MKTVEQMIQRSRRYTRTDTTGSTTAGKSIDDQEFVEHLNDGQELCVEMISGVFSTLFERTKIYTIDTSQTDYEELDIPTYLLLNTRIASVEYSHSGQEDDYVNIYPVDIRERYSGRSFSRSTMAYIFSGDKIIASERPKNGSKFRVVYEYKIPRLDVAKATVLTGSRSGTDFTGTYNTSTAHADVVANWVVGMSILRS